ncbi:histidinol-phosphate transaminase [soil metagenome]
MATSMNRRNWLKASALLAGSLTFISGAVTSVIAKPASMLRKKRMTDEMFDEMFDEMAAEEPSIPKLRARLFANENPFGPSSKAKKAIKEALPTSYQYAFAKARELGGNIAAYEGVKKEQVMINAGSSPILLAAALHFSKNGGNIISGDPSYEDLTDRVEGFNGKWVRVPLTSEYKLDLDAMEKAVDEKTSLVYIVNPNNPTGTVVDTAKLKAFCERVSKRTTVFVDEAYIDYLPDPRGTTLIDCVKKGQNVIVARTFSKLYGFAGLRVGYAIAQPEMIKTLSDYTNGDGSISATSLNAALASYNDTDFLQDALKKTNASKDYLYSVLTKEGYSYIPSSANFVMFPLNMDAERFVGEMMKRGVGVRPWKFNNKNWCRVSIGKMSEMQAFAEAFKEVS